jgi:type IV pilus assembly protein PilA
LDKEVQMLLKLRERMASEQGFTLIELLVVMLIIGILAAIAIPTFFNQKEKAQDADAKSMAHAAQTAMETYSVDHNGTYAAADGAALTLIEGTVNSTDATKPMVTVVGTPNASDYQIHVTSPKTGNSFDIKRAGGTFTFPCATAGQGGCPSGTGGWGG